MGPHTLDHIYLAAPGACLWRIAAARVPRTSIDGSDDVSRVGRALPMSCTTGVPALLKDDGPYPLKGTASFHILHRP